MCDANINATFKYLFFALRKLALCIFAFSEYKWYWYHDDKSVKYYNHTILRLWSHKTDETETDANVVYHYLSNTHWCLWCRGSK